MFIVMPNQFVFDTIAIMGALLGLAGGIALWTPIQRAVDRIAYKLFPPAAPNPATRIDLAA